MRDVISDARLRLLHDASLLTISVDWRQRTMQLELRVVPGREARLLAEGLRGLQLERNEPWGPSASINKARVDHESRLPTLWLQMQSGDVITVSADSLLIEDEE